MGHMYTNWEDKPTKLVGVVKSKYSYCVNCFKTLEYVGIRSTFCPECREIEKEKGQKALATSICTVAMFFIPVIGWFLSFIIYLVSIGNTVKTAQLINEVQKQV